SQGKAGGRVKPRFWLTPPEFYASLNSEFNFDFDPCPFPRPAGYNSLTLPWGRSNYINPPFLKCDAPHGGPAAFVRKGIDEVGGGYLRLCPAGPMEHRSADASRCRNPLRRTS